MRKKLTTLYGKDAENFLKRVAEDLKKPVGMIPTPHINEVKDKIKELSKVVNDGKMQSL